MVLVMFAPLRSAPPRSAFEKLMLERSAFFRSNITISAFLQSRLGAQVGQVGVAIVVVVVAAVVVVVELVDEVLVVAGVDVIV